MFWQLEVRLFYLREWIDTCLWTGGGGGGLSKNANFARTSCFFDTTLQLCKLLWETQNFSVNRLRGSRGGVSTHRTPLTMLEFYQHVSVKVGDLTLIYEQASAFFRKGAYLLFELPFPSKVKNLANIIGKLLFASHFLCPNAHTRNFQCWGLSARRY